MAVEETRKLKRGLRDVSSLFDPQKGESGNSGSSHPLTSNRVSEPFVEVLSVFSPEAPGDSLFLNTFLASRIASPEKPCSILSIRDAEFRGSFGARRNCVDESLLLQMESYGVNLRRLVLSPEQFEQICLGSPRRGLADPVLSQVLFLDLDVGSLCLTPIEKAISLLNKWILLLKPCLESLTETYKWMKAACDLNRDLEYFILFEGSGDDRKGAILFEKLSEMVARHLHIHLLWLGTLNLKPHVQDLAAELALDHLFLKSVRALNSPEQISLAQFIQSLSPLPKAQVS